MNNNFWNTPDILPYLTIIRGYKKNSLKLVTSRLEIFKKYLQENSLELTSDNIEVFLSAKKSETGNNNTVNSYVCAINKLIGYFDHKGINDKELKQIKSLKKTRPPVDILSPDEIKKLLSVNLKYGHYEKFTNPSIFLNNVYRRMLMFLACTGCRYSEMANLKVKDVDVENGFVTFGDTKNSDWRRVGILEPLLSELRDHVVDKENSELLFTNLKGHKICEVTFSDSLKEKAKISGIKKRVHPHIFRHSFITQMIIQGVNIGSIARIVGHRDIKSTDYYTHLAIDQLKNEMLRHPLIREKTEPNKILKLISSAVEQFKLNEDQRFSYEVAERNNGLSIEIKVI